MPEDQLIFAVTNQKGGVGKTTTAVNLSASLAVSERRTLLVDLDPQGNASSALALSSSSPHIYDALVGEASASDVVYPTELPHLFVIPSGKDLVGAEIELVTKDAREMQLARLLGELRNRFDLILIDCPPSLGLLTINALSAANRLIIPLQAEYYALEGLAHLLDTVERIRDACNPSLELMGILLTMFDSRNNLGHQVASEVRSHFGDRVFTNVIPRNVRLSEAPSFAKPAILYDARSAGAQAYLRVAQELLASIGERKGAKTPEPAVEDIDDAKPTSESSTASIDASITRHDAGGSLKGPERQFTSFPKVEE